MTSPSTPRSPERFAVLARRIEEATGDKRGSEEVAAGFLEIAVANMANAIKKISVQRGYDVTRYVLATFGGAGGQHACAVADVLGMTKVLVHPLAGVLSAYGMGLADVIAMRESAVEARLSAEPAARAGPCRDEPRSRRPRRTRSRWRRGRQVSSIRRAHLRYEGTDTAVPVPMGQVAGMVSEFEAAYRQRFSFLMRDKPIVVEAVSVELAGGGERAGRHGARCRARRTRSTRSACSSRVRGPMCRCIVAATAPGPGGAGSGNHRRGLRHHRGGAGLAGDRHRPG